jgi:hypothetical protein
VARKSQEQGHYCDPHGKGGASDLGCASLVMPRVSGV